MGQVEIRRSTQPTDDTKGESVSDLHQTIGHEEQYCPKKKKKSTYNKLRLAHHRVRMKNPASTRHAILLALVSNPHAINAAPIKEEPRYPAGRVTARQYGRSLDVSWWRRVVPKKSRSVARGCGVSRNEEKNGDTFVSFCPQMHRRSFQSRVGASETPTSEDGSPINCVYTYSKVFHRSFGLRHLRRLMTAGGDRKKGREGSHKKEKNI